MIFIVHIFCLHKLRITFKKCHSQFLFDYNSLNIDYFAVKNRIEIILYFISSLTNLFF